MGKNYQFCHNKATDSKFAKVKEYGCWIILDTETGKYSIEELIGKEIVMDTSLKVITASVEFNFSPTTYNDPTAKPKVTVANFHTHYPLCWTRSKKIKAEFKRNDVGPSGNDKKIANKWQMPGIVYDYVKEIEYDHKFDAPKKLYTFGDQSRWIY